MAKSITLNEDATKHDKGPVLTFAQRMAGMQCLMGMLKQQRDLSQLNSININPLALADETIAMCKAYGKMKEDQLVDTERLDLIMQHSRRLPYKHCSLGKSWRLKTESWSRLFRCSRATSMLAAMASMATRCLCPH